MAELNRAGGDHRIRVTTPTRVRTAAGDRDVTVVALSARSALVLAPEPLGEIGRTIDLLLPGIGGAELEITAGIARTDRVHEGAAVVVQFMIAEPSLRRALSDLLALLLAGDGGGTRKHPRVIYDVRVRIGSEAEHIGRLEEISLSGASVRAPMKLLHDEPLIMRVPLVRSGSFLRLVGRVVSQRKALDGGLHTGVSFDALDERMRIELGTLLADLMCR
ncbi:MAG TPA: PilZ domain-containing protein [Polyangia bacterium]|nr:PilZ domain-containing protein [Polyangia bacterium]